MEFHMLIFNLFDALHVLKYIGFNDIDNYNFPNSSGTFHCTI